MSKKPRRTWWQWCKNFLTSTNPADNTPANADAELEVMEEILEDD